MDRDDRMLAFLQGRMDAQESEEFEAEMARDRSLSAEVSAMRNVRSAFSDESFASQRQQGWARLSEALESEARPVANDNRPIRFSLWQVAATVAGAVLLWQATVAPILTPDGGDGYVPVSETVQGPVLQVAFTADASIGAVSDLVVAAGGTIVSGPGSIGVYQIAFPDEAARDAARLAFQERTDLIRLSVGD